MDAVLETFQQQCYTVVERQETRAKADGERRHRRYSGRVVGRVRYNYSPISILLQFCK